MFSIVFKLLQFEERFRKDVLLIGSISAALSCLVSPAFGEERRLISRTAAGNRAYPLDGFDSVNGRPNRRNKAAFSFFSVVL